MSAVDLGMSAAPLLSARGVTKHFPGVRALAGIDLDLAAGEVLGIVGQNGAGKSTLLRVLAGDEAPDAGTLAVAGAPVPPGSVRAALAAGIALIHQEPEVADNLDLAGAVLLGREFRRAGVFLDRPRMAAEAARVLRRLGLELPPDTPVARLSPGARQLVEIAAALSARAKVLILDEPTSSLSRTESLRLLAVVRELAAAGTGVLYVSHRLAEVVAVADRALVLRDGELAGELRGGAIQQQALVRLMVGRDVAPYGRRPQPPGAVLLELERLASAAHPRCAVSLSVRAGEIVGLAGLVGAGRSELLTTLFGLRLPAGGVVRVRGRPLPPGDPAAAVAAGLALVPEERREQGLVLGASLRENLSLARLARDARYGLVDRRAERALAARLLAELSIRAAGPRALVDTLSGGNQQKVVLGRWLACEPSIFLLDEPTRGVDVAAKAEIHRWIDALAARGAAVLCASSELEELLALADRILVLHEGRLAGELAAAGASEESLLALATGGEAR